MTKKKYRRYSPEFKRHVLKRASEDAVTDKAFYLQPGPGSHRIKMGCLDPFCDTNVAADGR